MKGHGFARLSPTTWGDPAFWAVVSEVSASRRRDRRAYFNDAETRRLVAAVQNREVPGFVWQAIGATREAFRRGWRPGSEDPFAAIVRLKNEAAATDRAARSNVAPFSRRALREV